MMKSLKDCKEMRNFADNNFGQNSFDEQYMKSKVLADETIRKRQECFGLLLAFGGMWNAHRTPEMIKDFSWRILVNYCRFCFAKTKVPVQTTAPKNNSNSNVNVAVV